MKSNPKSTRYYYLKGKCFLVCCCILLIISTLQAQINQGSIGLEVEESENHYTVTGTYTVSDSVRNIPDNLSYYVLVEGKSGIPEKPYVFKTKRNDFVLEGNVPKTLFTIKIDQRDTLSVEVKIKSGKVIIDQQKDTWTQREAVPIVLDEKEKRKEKRDSPSVVEIDGLIIDQTKTKAGRDFYELFYNNWIPPRGATDFTINIAEDPGRGRSTIIRILVNDQIVFKRFLQARYDVIEELSKNAIGVTANRIKKLTDTKNQIEEGDQVGDGIF